MRLAALAGLFACVAIFTSSSSTASAEAFGFLNIKETDQVSLKVANAGVTNPIVMLASAKTETASRVTQPEEPVTEVYQVEDGDTLSSIAEKYQTTWKRIFDKNEDISHPDLIQPGDMIVIPRVDEQLGERPLPEAPAQQQPVTEPVRQRTYASAARQYDAPAASVSRGSSSGNTYTPGYCTWYAKNKRPDLPNNLGNADTWVARAAAQGIPTGSVPRAGAIGQQGMHVVYVERVNADGTVFVSEMNFKGLYVISTRTVPASYFQYIY